MASERRTTIHDGRRDVPIKEHPLDDFVSLENENEEINERNRAFQKAVADKLEDTHRAAQRANGGPTPAPPGCVGFIGGVGSGKTIIANSLCITMYAAGRDVYWTTAAGLAYGIPFNLKEDPRALTRFGNRIENAVILVDELQSYINPYRAMSKANVEFLNSMAGIRKQGCMLVYTTQLQANIPKTVRRSTTQAHWPYLKLGASRTIEGETRTTPNQSGQWDHGKYALRSLFGPNCLTALEEEDAMQTHFGIGAAKPTKSESEVDYATLITSGMLYNTLAKIDIIGDFS